MNNPELYRDKFIRIINKRIYFYTNYDPAIINMFKQNKLKWDPSYRAWYDELENYLNADDVCLKLNEVFSIYPEDEKRYSIKFMEACFKELSNIIELSRSSVSDFPVPLPEGLKLFSYQKAGVEFLVSRKNVLLADQMGLGKTIQIIGYLNFIINTGKIPSVLIVCPASVKYNWEKELKKWLIAPLSIEVLEGKNGFEQNPQINVYISNYDILKDKNFTNLNIIVLDEAHYIKNEQAQRTKEVQRICKANPKAKIIALTGTPMLNRPRELFPILKILEPSRFNNFFRFAITYCGAYKKSIHTKEGKKEFWDFNGASNTEELGRLLRATVMLRREKTEVLRELPDKIRTVIPIKKPITGRIVNIENETQKIVEKIKEINKKIYQAKKKNNNELLNQLRIEKTEIRSVALPLINEYRRLAFEEKKDSIVSFLDDVLPDEKIVLFVHHLEVADFFKNTFSHLNPCIITGQTPPQQRQIMIDSFNRDKNHPLFIATILAAAEGITLTASSTVVFAEYEWTPAKMLQAEDRCHRIGQKKTVNSYWFTLQNSIDEMFINKIIEKLEIGQSIMQDKTAEEIFMAVE